MNLICLLKRHVWQFSYNHDMPRGTSLEGALTMFQRGKTFEVYVCTRCKRQARLIGGKMVRLPKAQVESP